MENIKDMWKDAKWPVKAIVISMGVALFVKVILWMQQMGWLTNAG